MFSKMHLYVGQKLKIKAIVSIVSSKNEEKYLLLKHATDYYFKNLLFDNIKLKIPKRYKCENFKEGDIITFKGIIKKDPDDYKIHHPSDLFIKIRKFREDIPKGGKHATFKTIRRTPDVIRSNRRKIRNEYKHI